MAIPVNTIVQVTITTTPQTVSRAGFGTGLFLTRETGVIPLNEGIRTYASLSEVTTDWAGTDVEDAATAYFGQNPAPERFAVGQRYLTAQAGFNFGSSSGVEDDPAVWAVIADGSFNISIDGSNEDITAVDFTGATAGFNIGANTAESNPATWAAISDGSFNISIDGDNQDITGVDFSGDASMTDVAATIEADLQAIGTGGYTAATCVWDTDHFVITSGTTGASSTVSYVTTVSPATGTDVAVLMDMDSGQGTLVDGTDSVTAMDDVAAKIEEALQTIGTGGYSGALCEWTGTQFKITSGTTGASSTVSYVTAVSPATGTDIADLMAMDNGEGTLQSGIDAETDIADALNRLNDVADGNPNLEWYFLYLNAAERDTSDTEDAAAWTETQIKQLWAVSNNPDATNSGISTDIGSVLNALNYTRTWMQWSSQPTEYPEIAASAKAAVVQFTGGTDTTITMMFQQITGITEEDITTAQMSTLTGKGYNAYVNVGGVGIIQEGIMVAGVGTWQDTIHGVDWLQNAIETNVFNYLLTRGTKVPLTDAGVQAVIQQIVDALEEGVTNGLIARSGTTTNDVFLPNGYTISAGKVADLSIADKQARKAPLIQFTAIGAGAIHSVDIQGVFEG